MEHVNQRRDLRGPTERNRVGDDADDLAGRLLVIRKEGQGQLLPDRIAAGPLLLGERLVHEHHPGRVGEISGREVPPTNDANPHRLEVVLGDGQVLPRDLIVGRVFGVPG